MSILNALQPVPSVEDRIKALGVNRNKPSVPRPSLTPSAASGKVFLGIASFQRHMSNEGWQLQHGLSSETGGFELWGKGLPNDSTDVPYILNYTDPHTVILQDRREWHSANPACIAKGEDFIRHEELGRRPHIFKLTVLKDAHHDAGDGRSTAQLCGVHAWITYYHPEMVHALAPYTRKEHLVRTYHSLDPAMVPPFGSRAGKCLLSGALSAGVYPLRTRLFKDRLPNIDRLNHPGYHAHRSHTNDFLKTLVLYKVAICTASIYGYALRKIIEATACGCRVITDLPPDEVLPEIDGNLIRVPPSITNDQMVRLVDEVSSEWDHNTQQAFASKAVHFYDYRATTARLAADIESLRQKMLSENA